MPLHNFLSFYFKLTDCNSLLGHFPDFHKAQLYPSKTFNFLWKEIKSLEILRCMISLKIKFA